MEGLIGWRMGIRVAIAGLLALAVSLTSLIGCGGGQDSSTEASTPVVCKPAKAHEPWNGQYPAPNQAVDKGEDLVALVMTSCGAFRIDLDTERAPKTVNSFAHLARIGFYEGLAFDRMEPGFMVQAGDPLGTGTNSSGPGYSTVEKPPADLTYTRGMVAMAKRPSDAPGYSRSQFFIVLADDAELPPEYALIGEVDKSLNVVEKIGEFGTRSGKPTKTVTIEWIWAKKPSQKEEESSAAWVPPSLL